MADEELSTDVTRANAYLRQRNYVRAHVCRQRAAIDKDATELIDGSPTLKNSKNSQ